MSGWFTKDPRYSVDEQWVRTPYKDYRTDDIAGIEVSRLPVTIVAALSAGVIAAAYSLRALLYVQELVFIAALIVLALFLAWRLAWIRIKGDPFRGEEGRVWCSWSRAQWLRAEIEDVLSKRERAS